MGIPGMGVGSLLRNFAYDLPGVLSSELSGLEKTE